ncbi:hypothetical protein CHS0354_030142 [Potamilus streckersoni]|uniref:TIR domain-containing protein n=1 Tax=Potamilus streckersoni TaxID=2493646 RepID=A0AAE0W0K5_9BIVA|nr:hypothetical protein CHS0354_030142 [Potamilus streckersoni]
MDVHVIIDELPLNTTVDNPSMGQKPLPPDKKFHIFFSYTDVPSDKRWVKAVISKLETEYSYICCDHERDFLPGTKIMANIKDGVKNSEKVVVVFSKEALESHYVLLEAEMAHKLCLQRRKNLLIPVLLDDCDVPEEFMLLTYIDARDGVEETTWWPRLLKSIESTGESSRSPFHIQEKSAAADPTFAVSQLCSIETKYRCLRCSIQAVSKYVPAELRPEATGVPVDLIRATYKDLLQSPTVVYRQKCCCFATSWVVFWSLGFAVLFAWYFFILILCIAQPPEGKQTLCLLFDSVSFLLWIAIAVCCYVGCKCGYLKNPDSVNKNIIEHNRNLSKHGVMVTIVHGCMWRKASLIFYKCRFEPCKEYVIRHLVKEDGTGITEHRDVPYSGLMVALNEDSLLLPGVGEPNPGREQSITNVNGMNPMLSEDAEDFADVADNEPLLSIQETENLDYENKALNMLLSCTPEYFALAYANKLKNPKEDRHGIEFMCLCQYLEQTDTKFQDTVKRTTFLRSHIEENSEDENNKPFEHISLY